GGEPAEHEPGTEPGPARTARRGGGCGLGPADYPGERLAGCRGVRRRGAGSWGRGGGCGQGLDVHAAVPLAWADVRKLEVWPESAWGFTTRSRTALRARLYLSSKALTEQPSTVAASAWVRSSQSTSRSASRSAGLSAAIAASTGSHLGSEF